MTDVPFWLAVGAFVTSSGFGAIIALIAAGVAYGNVTRTLAANRSAAVEAANTQRRLARDAHQRSQDRELAADARQRWWEALLWISANAERLTPEEVVEALKALTTPDLNPKQLAMLRAVTQAAARSAMKGPARS